MPPASLTRAYEHWLGSWETELAALATATESRTLTMSEAGTHKAVIAVERELVTKQFELLRVDRPIEIRVWDQGVAPMS